MGLGWHHPSGEHIALPAWVGLSKIIVTNGAAEAACVERHVPRGLEGDGRLPRGAPGRAWGGKGGATQLLANPRPGDLHINPPLVSRRCLSYPNHHLQNTRWGQLAISCNRGKVDLEISALGEM